MHKGLRGAEQQREKRKRKRLSQGMMEYISMMACTTYASSTRTKNITFVHTHTHTYTHTQTQQKNNNHASQTSTHRALIKNAYVEMIHQREVLVVIYHIHLLDRLPQEQQTPEHCNHGAPSLLNITNKLQRNKVHPQLCVMQPLGLNSRLFKVLNNFLHKRNQIARGFVLQCSWQDPCSCPTQQREHSGASEASTNPTQTQRSKH